MAHVVRGLLVLALLAAVELAAFHAHGQRLLSVQSPSMRPTFQPGDALIVTPVKSHQLRVGQVISYRSPRDPRLVISHRLVKVDRPTGWLTTQGDALRTADQPFPPNLVVGRATAVAPGLGRLLDWLHRPIGLLLMVYLPALALIISETLRLAAHFNRPYSVRLYV